MEIRVGQGIDVHRFAPGRDFIIGGVKIDHPLGLQGHSDADVLLHAVIDALLGASGLGDIGQMFPDTDSTWQNASSLMLLQLAWEKVSSLGWQVVNLDCNVLVERPKIAAHAQKIRKNISQVLKIDETCCNLKAGTNEKLGFIGREEGCLASAVVLLKRKD